MDETQNNIPEEANTVEMAPPLMAVEDVTLPLTEETKPADVQEAVKEECHPAHSVIDELEEEINRLGSYAISKLSAIIVRLRTAI